MITKEQGEQLFLKALNLRLSNTGSINQAEFANIQKSCMQNKIHFIQNELKRDIGYICWADINKESFLNLTKFALPPQFSYEWDEGKILLLLDIYFPKNYPVRKILEALKTKFPKRRLVLFNKKGSVRVYKKWNNRYVRLQIT